MSELDTNISATALKALSVLDFIGEQRRPVTRRRGRGAASAPTARPPTAC